MIVPRRSRVKQMGVITTLKAIGINEDVDSSLLHVLYSPVCYVRVSADTGYPHMRVSSFTIIIHETPALPIAPNTMTTPIYDKKYAVKKQIQSWVSAKKVATLWQGFE